MGAGPRRDSLAAPADRSTPTRSQLGPGTQEGPGLCSHPCHPSPPRCLSSSVFLRHIIPQPPLQMDFLEPQTPAVGMEE